MNTLRSVKYQCWSTVSLCAANCASLWGSFHVREMGPFLGEGVQKVRLVRRWGACSAGGTQPQTLCAAPTPANHRHHLRVALVLGLAERRHCTDCTFLLLFLLFWVGMVFISYVGYSNGDLWRLYYGTDFMGNVCTRPRCATGFKEVTGFQGTRAVEGYWIHSFYKERRKTFLQ